MSGPLIQILGYKFEHGCTRTDASLITADAERAFLTVDSGFPLTKLEQSLQEGVPFAYAFPATQVPILFTESDWVGLIPSKQRTGSTAARPADEQRECGPALLGPVAARPADEARAVPCARAQEIALLRPGARLLWKPDLHPRRGGGCARRPSGRAVLARTGGSKSQVAGRFRSSLARQGSGLAAAYFDALSRVEPGAAGPPRGRRPTEGSLRGLPLGRSRLRRSNQRLPEECRSAAPAHPPAMGPSPANLRCREASHSGRRFSRTRKKGRITCTQSLRHVPPADSPDQLLEALVAYSNVLIARWTAADLSEAERNRLPRARAASACRMIPRDCLPAKFNELERLVLDLR